VGRATDEIVFATDIAGLQKDFDSTGVTWDLWLIKPDGTGLRKLTTGAPRHQFGSPRWAPDGKHVTAYDHAIPGGVIVDRATGTSQPFVTTGDDTRPTIRPVP
jgi:Tol biopolymer transport system component